MKQDCPFCGKASIDGRHLRLCSQRPQEAPEVVLVEENKGLGVDVKIPSILGNSECCPKCGEAIKRLNETDIRCLKCGDYEARIPRR